MPAALAWLALVLAEVASPSLARRQAPLMLREALALAPLSVAQTTKTAVKAAPATSTHSAGQAAPTNQAQFQQAPTNQAQLLQGESPRRNSNKQGKPTPLRGLPPPHPHSESQSHGGLPHDDAWQALVMQVPVKVDETARPL
mmetsp:Transcript_21658/g.38039  ORF Transcript_21658/g.38039 Transcript_21658/m.38039 type:complete len:142 (-) Transcript_21658:96-521(-)